MVTKNIPAACAWSAPVTASMLHLLLDANQSWSLLVCEFEWWVAFLSKPLCSSCTHLIWSRQFYPHDWPAPQTLAAVLQSRCSWLHAALPPAIEDCTTVCQHLGAQKNQCWRHVHLAMFQFSLLYKDVDGSQLFQGTRLRWMGHLWRIADDRIPQCKVFGGALLDAQQAGPRATCDDQLVHDLAELGILKWFKWCQARSEWTLQGRLLLWL